MSENCLQTLRSQVESSSDLEQKLELLRSYKRSTQQSLKQLYQKDQINFIEVSKQLSELADAILQVTLEMALSEMQKNFGKPLCENGEPGKLAIIGMGKLGGQELHFHSDLDLIFIFNQSGQTQGTKKITHQEYFSRATQKIINYLTVYTRGGYGYKVDTELRPSGNTGTLVSSLKTWREYYQQNAALWERQALLKARVSAAETDFAKAFETLFPQFIFFQKIPEDMASQMQHLRNRIEKELSQESRDRWNLKKGHGGLVDIEFAVQFLQLKYGVSHPQLLETNTRQAMRILQDEHLLNDELFETLLEAHDFYRRFEIDQEVFFEKAESHFSNQSGHLDFLAKRSNLSSEKDLYEKIKSLREEVRKCYLKILEIDSFSPKKEENIH